MDFLFQTDPGICRAEIYSQYLKKIPALYHQIEITEKMFQKADLELNLLNDTMPDSESAKQYRLRLESLKTQAQLRTASLKEELQLILLLKEKIEADLPKI